MIRFLAVFLTIACLGPVGLAQGPEPRAVVDQAYAAVAAGDGEAFARLIAPDAVWNEAEGNPYADRNPYLGPPAVLEGLFARFAVEWTDAEVVPQDYVAEGNRLVVFGRYRETYVATGKRADIPFVHLWTIDDGRITAFQQYTDTWSLRQAMTPATP